MWEWENINVARTRPLIRLTTITPSSERIKDGGAEHEAVVVVVVHQK